MNLTELEPNERVALVGLVLAMIDADAEASMAELEELRAIESELGTDAFRAAHAEALGRLSTPDATIGFAQEAVNRQPARELIHTILVDMATTDGIAEEEQALLAKLRDVWGLRTRG